MVDSHCDDSGYSFSPRVCANWEFAHANRNSAAKPYLSLAPGFLH